MKFLYALVLLPLSLSAVVPLQKKSVKMSEVISKINDLDKNVTSPTLKSKKQVGQFFIGKEQVLLEAIAQTEYLLHNHYRQLTHDQAQQLYDALAYIVSQLANGTLTEHFHNVLMSQAS